MTDKFQWKRGSYQNPLYIFYQDDSGAFSPENFQYSTGTVQRPAFVITLDGSGNQIFPVPEAPSDSVVYGRKNGAWVNIDTGDDTRYVNTAGDTMTGALVMPAGSVTAASLAVNDAGTGLFSNTSGSLSVSTGGDERIRLASARMLLSTGNTGASKDPTELLHLYGLGTNARMLLEAEASATVDARRYSTDATGPLQVQRKARGTIASPTVVASGDATGSFQFNGYDGAAFKETALISTSVTSATPSSTTMTGRMMFNLTNSGITRTEVARLEVATGFSMFGANPVIDQNRHFRRRSYTFATLPAASVLGSAQISDGAAAPIWSAAAAGGGTLLTPVYTDGTTWRNG